MKLKLIQSYLLVARHKFEGQRYDEAISEYDTALAYITELAEEEGDTLDQFGILDSDPWEAEEEERELFKLSLIRAEEQAECWTLRRTGDESQKARDVFRHLLSKHADVIPSLTSISLEDIQFHYAQILYHLQDYQKACEVLNSPPILGNRSFQIEFLHGDIYKKLDQFDDATEKYLLALQDEEIKKDRTTKERIYNRLIDCRNLKKTKERINQETVEFSMRIGEEFKQIAGDHDDETTEAVDYEFKSDVEALQEIKKFLTQNSNLCDLEITICGYGRDLLGERSIASNKKNIYGTEYFRVELLEETVKKILPLLKLSKTLHTFSLSVAMSNCGGLNSKSVVTAIKNALNERPSLFALDIGRLSLNDTDKSQIVALCNRNFIFSVWKARIYQVYTLVTVGMQVRPNQTWDDLAKCILPFLEDPSVRLRKQGYALYKLSPSIKLPGNIDKKNLTLRNDKWQQFTSFNWRSQYFTGVNTHQSKWKFNINAKWINYALRDKVVQNSSSSKALVIKRDGDGEPSGKRERVESKMIVPTVIMEVTADSNASAVASAHVSPSASPSAWVSANASPSAGASNGNASQSSHSMSIS